MIIGSALTWIGEGLRLRPPDPKNDSRHWPGRTRWYRDDIILHIFGVDGMCTCWELHAEVVVSDWYYWVANKMYDEEHWKATWFELARVDPKKAQQVLDKWISTVFKPSLSNPRYVFALTWNGLPDATVWKISKDEHGNQKAEHVLSPLDEFTKTPEPNAWVFNGCSIRTTLFKPLAYELWPQDVIEHNYRNAMIAPKELESLTASPEYSRWYQNMAALAAKVRYDRLSAAGYIAPGMPAPLTQSNSRFSVTFKHLGKNKLRIEWKLKELGFGIEGFRNEQQFPQNPSDLRNSQPILIESYQAEGWVEHQLESGKEYYYTFNQRWKPRWGKEKCTYLNMHVLMPSAAELEADEHTREKARADELQALEHEIARAKREYDALILETRKREATRNAQAGDSGAQEPEPSLEDFVQALRDRVVKGAEISAQLSEDGSLTDEQREMFQKHIEKFQEQSITEILQRFKKRPRV